MRIDQLAIIGVGLLGGSVGLAAKARKVADRVVGVGRSERPLSRARSLGAIDTFTTELAGGVSSADVVVVCTPVDRVAEDVLAVLRHAKPTAVVTDVGSTKAAIVAQIQNCCGPNSSRFVGSHPLAGSEKQGVEHARADLFHDRVVVTTPAENSEATAADRIEPFWKALGAKTIRMLPRDHDAAVAVTSHLPHAAAAGLAKMTPLNHLPLAAGGFKDTTRIAAGDPELWAAIFLANRGVMIAALDEFAETMSTFRRALTAGDKDAVVRWLAEAKRVRDALGS